MWRFLLILVSLLPAVARGQIQRVERESLLDSDPEVVYMEKTVKAPIIFKVIKQAPVFSTRYGSFRRGFLEPDQKVKLEAITDKVYRVRVEGERHGISGWVGPWAFESKDPEFVDNLKKLYERQLEVRALIDAHDVAIGMTIGEVSSSLGKPVKTTARKIADGETGKWEYIEYEDVKHYINRIDPYTGAAFRQYSHTTREEKSKTSVEFEDNIVTAIEKTKDEKGANVRIIVPPVLFRW